MYNLIEYNELVRVVKNVTKSLKNSEHFWMMVAGESTLVAPKE